MLKKSLVYWLLSLLLYLSLGGCASPQKTAMQDAHLLSGDVGAIHVYRPSSDWRAPAITFKVYINGRLVSDLYHGGEVLQNVKVGTHVVDVKAFFLGFQDGKTASHTVDIKAGNNAYLRFVQNLDGFAPVGTTGVVKGHFNLSQVDAAVWREKR